MPHALETHFPPGKNTRSMVEKASTRTKNSHARGATPARARSFIYPRLRQRRARSRLHRYHSLPARSYSQIEMRWTDYFAVCLGHRHLGRKRAKELVLLFLRLEAAVTVLGRGVDELELHLLKNKNASKNKHRGEKRAGASLNDVALTLNNLKAPDALKRPKGCQH